MEEIISPQKIAQIVVMARELGRAEGELRGFIDRLNEDEQAAVVAVMWIGRGSFDVEDWEEAYQTAMAEATSPTADYLIGTPHLAENLENGLEAFGISVSDAEDDALGR
ncbi:MAG: DUF3775 domain-containing protein [Roseivivax sp.]|nr:DUF3775 domain-containing protein [Roseivivax sp.]